MSNTATNFDAVQIGDTLGPEEIFLSKDQVRAYAHTCGMDVPRFTDDEGARKEGLPGMIAPGNMSLGLLSKLVTDWIGTSGARLVRLGTTYRQLVQPGRTIILDGFVTHVEPADKRVEIDVWIESDEADRLVIGTATVEFP
jgi:acyl dehydratase